MISVNLNVQFKDQFQGSYVNITFHRALLLLNDLLAEYGEGLKYDIFNGKTGEVIESVDLNRVRQPIYAVSDMVELVPYLDLFKKVTTLDGYVLWDCT